MADGDGDGDGDGDAIAFFSPTLGEFRRTSLGPPDRHFALRCPRGFVRKAKGAGCVQRS